MRWASNRNLNTAVILTFFAVWLWSEVMEYRADKQFQEDVDEFMTAGDRFTGEDGNDLRGVVDQNKRIMAAMNRRMDATDRRVELLERHVIEEVDHMKAHTGD